MENETQNLLKQKQPNLQPEELQVPEKFLDSKTGEVRLNDLVKSYLALEKKLSSKPAEAPMDFNLDDLDDEKINLIRRAQGVPETSKEYDVNIPHPMLDRDEEVFDKFHQEGFTPKQVQLVYDLAAERIIPIIADLAAEFEADKQLEKLVSHFGGDEKFNEVSKQISTWAEKNVAAEVFEALGSTYEGVITLYKMMSSNEPAISKSMGGAEALSEDKLKEMMKDPKYWRDKDSSYVSMIEQGFKKLYPSAK